MRRLYAPWSQATTITAALHSLPCLCMDCCGALRRTAHRRAARLQVEGLIIFDDKIEPLLQWDRQIESICNKVNDIVSSAAPLLEPPAVGA